MKSIIFMLILLLLCANIDSQWERVNLLPNSAGAYRLVSTPEYIAFATAQIVYYSNNDVSSLQPVHNLIDDSFIYALCANSNDIFVGTLNGVYKRDLDDQLAPSGLSGLYVTALTMNNEVMFAGVQDEPGNNGVYISKDNGTSWSITALNNQEIVTLNMKDSYIYAGTKNGLLISTNYGERWWKSGLKRVSNVSISEKYVYAGTKEGVLRSDDIGFNWLYTGLTIPNIYYVLVFESSVFACAGNGQFYVSKDNGKTWEKRAAGLGWAEITSLCVFKDYVYATTLTGLVRCDMTYLTQ